MPPPLAVSFVAGAFGPWQIEAIRAVAGDGLSPAARLGMDERGTHKPEGASWVLRGTTSNLRYTHRQEAQNLAAQQEGLRRPKATCAALIPIRKSESWWALAQDERRAVIEDQSRHIAIGTEYLPAIARRLHHCRDIGESFDFLTWFEFAPEDATLFDRLVERLRASAEWQFVDREVEIRLRRDR